MKPAIRLLMKPTLLFILLTAPIRIFAPPLSMAGKLEADSAKNAAFFDGASNHPAKTESPSTAAEDKERLAAEFEKRLTINDHGSPEERAALDSLISRMMDSATAREIAAKFIEENAKAALSFEEIPGSAVVTKDGKKTFWGTRGRTFYKEDPPRVILNKLFMQYDGDQGTGTLAHEMLGHAFERQRAGDFLRTIQYYNTNEEENARLIGWLVRTELNVKPEDEIWDYMRDPEEDMRSIKLLAPDYAITLTSSEMKDPASVYKIRLADTDKALESLLKKPKRWETWIKVSDHFVNVHKMDPASFQTIRDYLNGSLATFPAKQKRLENIKAALESRLDAFPSAEGKAFLEILAKESDNAYFTRKGAVIKERRARLEGLLLGKTQESGTTPPQAGQITFDQLVELVTKDRTSCPSVGEAFK